MLKGGQHAASVIQTQLDTNFCSAASDAMQTKIRNLMSMITNGTEEKTDPTDLLTHEERGRWVLYGVVQDGASPCA